MIDETEVSRLADRWNLLRLCENLLDKMMGAPGHPSSYPGASHTD